GMKPAARSMVPYSGAAFQFWAAAGGAASTESHAITTSERAKGPPPPDVHPEKNPAEATTFAPGRATDSASAEGARLSLLDQRQQLLAAHRSERPSARDGNEAGRAPFARDPDLDVGPLEIHPLPHRLRLLDS